MKEMIMQNEEWRDIEGYEGHYQISSLGRVRSCERKIKIGNHGGFRILPDRVMRPWHSNGYLAVFLKKEGTVIKKSVHRLVAYAFLIPVPEEADTMVVNHKDRNRHNNAVINLEWATYSENGHHYHHDDKLKAGNHEVPF